MRLFRSCTWPDTAKRRGRLPVNTPAAPIPRPPRPGEIRRGGWASGWTESRSSRCSRVRCAARCERANWPGLALAEIDPDLTEWDYGDYEGRLTADILAERPGWQLFRDGSPGGESPEQVAA